MSFPQLFKLGLHLDATVVFAFKLGGAFLQIGEEFLDVVIVLALGGL